MSKKCYVDFANPKNKQRRAVYEIRTNSYKDGRFKEGDDEIIRVIAQLECCSGLQGEMRNNARWRVTFFGCDKPEISGLLLRSYTTGWFGDIHQVLEQATDGLRPRGYTLRP